MVLIYIEIFLVLLTKALLDALLAILFLVCKLPIHIFIHF